MPATPMTRPATGAPPLSIVIPVLDEAAGIEAGLHRVELSSLRDIDDPAGLASPPPEWRAGLPAMPGGRDVPHGG